MEINKVKLSVLSELERWRECVIGDSEVYKEAKATITRSQELSGKLEKHETQDPKEKREIQRILGYLSDTISFAHRKVSLYEATRKAEDDREVSLETARKARVQAQAQGIVQHKRPECF